MLPDNIQEWLEKFFKSRYKQNLDFVYNRLFTVLGERLVTLYPDLDIDGITKVVKVNRVTIGIGYNELFPNNEFNEHYARVLLNDVIQQNKQFSIKLIKSNMSIDISF
jgi:hypothetical protein